MTLIIQGRESEIQEKILKEEKTNSNSRSIQKNVGSDQLEVPVQIPTKLKSIRINQNSEKNENNTIEEKPIPQPQQKLDKKIEEDDEFIPVNEIEELKITEEEIQNKLKAEKLTNLTNNIQQIYNSNPNQTNYYYHNNNFYMNNISVYNSLPIPMNQYTNKLGNNVNNMNNNMNMYNMPYIGHQSNLNPMLQHQIKNGYMSAFDLCDKSNSNANKINQTNKENNNTINFNMKSVNMK